MFLLEILSRNQGQNLFGKGNYHTARKGKKSVGTLAWIVAFERQTDLHHSKAQHNHADRPYQPEHKVGQIVDNGNRIGFLSVRTQCNVRMGWREN